MYNILVVDDEAIERNGISYLIEQHKLPLKIFQASNGREALKIFHRNRIDILLTDIKMPFMDGLQLADTVRRTNPGVKIIIFSAYGEFDYAKQAINLEVMDYVLKPVKIAEFLKVMEKVIDSCKNEEIKKEKDEILHENLGVASQYIKEKLLVDLVSGVNHSESLCEKLQYYLPEFMNKYIQPILIDLTNRFFDVYHEQFGKGLKTLLEVEFHNLTYIYVNLNEHQSIVLLTSNFVQKLDNTVIKNICDSLHALINRISSGFSCIVAGKCVSQIQHIHEEFEVMEQLTQYKFFYDDSVILLRDHELSLNGSRPVSEELVMDNFYKLVDCHDFDNAEKCLDLFFGSVRNAEGYSAIYFKYLCIEICKKLMEISKQSAKTLNKDLVEKIFQADTFIMIKDTVKSLMREIASIQLSEQCSGKSIIDEVLEYIHVNYMCDLGLEMVADKVFISPGYLSILFKKETGKSFIKYLSSYRLEKATEFLKNSNLKIADISKRVGFFNESYFCMVFRNTYGISPSRYRGGEE